MPIGALFIRRYDQGLLFFGGSYDCATSDYPGINSKRNGTVSETRRLNLRQSVQSVCDWGGRGIRKAVLPQCRNAVLPQGRRAVLPYCRTASG
jgi:hypothetical protein